MGRREWDGKEGVEVEVTGEESRGGDIMAMRYVGILSRLSV